MRKTDETIYREVVGKGTQLTSSEFMSNQPFFKAGEKKAEQGAALGNARGFWLVNNRNKDSIYFSIAKNGNIGAIGIPPGSWGKDLTDIRVIASSSQTTKFTFEGGETKELSGELFEDASLPTHEELDFVKVVYGFDDQFFIDLGRVFSTVVTMFNKAVESGEYSFKFMKGEDW